MQIWTEYSDIKRKVINKSYPYQELVLRKESLTAAAIISV
jgi:hypothetical protein